MVVLAALLLISRLMMERAFKSFSEITLVLTDKYIERITSRENEKIYYTDIDGVSLKNTIRNDIRDKQFYLNGLVEINDFAKALQSSIGKDSEKSCTFYSQYWFCKGGSTDCDSINHDDDSFL